jgi:hypothetical protein
MLPSRMLLGREFKLRHNMELDLGRGLGSFEVKTRHGRARFNGSIRYGKREVGPRGSVAEVQESIEAVGDEDRDAIEAMNFAEFGDAEDQKALQEVLLEYPDVRKLVSECLAFELGRLRRPGFQARMVRYHPSRRFEMVAMDVFEMSPETKRGKRKVLVIGDLYSRYLVAVPISDERADTVARVTFDRWVSVFGPPEQLLTDLGPNFASGVISEMCRLIGTRKVFTSAYHPQTNGFIERYNRTLSTELRRQLSDEEDWDLSLSMAVFRYNATQHADTGMKPYKAVLGSEVFELDCGVLQRLNIDAEPEDLARRLAEVHAVEKRSEE